MYVRDFAVGASNSVLETAVEGLKADSPKQIIPNGGQVGWTVSRPKLEAVVAPVDCGVKNQKPVDAALESFFGLFGPAISFAAAIELSLAAVSHNAVVSAGRMTGNGARLLAGLKSNNRINEIHDQGNLRNLVISKTNIFLGSSLCSLLLHSWWLKDSRWGLE